MVSQGEFHHFIQCSLEVKQTVGDTRSRIDAAVVLHTHVEVGEVKDAYHVL